MDELRLRLAKLQDQFAGKCDLHRPIPTGWDEIDARLRGGLASGTVHEWFNVGKGLRARGTEGQRDPNRHSSIGNRQSSSPPLSILIHLAWQALLNDPHRVVLWIGRTCRPYFRALVHNPGQPHEDRLLLEQSVFLDVPATDLDARVWAIDLAARSSAVACIIADGSGLDMRASRRLQLAAQHGTALVLLARPAHELKQLSAAATRWTVSPSLHHFITSSHHSLTPRWTVALLRCKGLQPVLRGHELPREFALEVCRETGSLRLSPHVADRSGSQTNQEEVRARLRRSA